MPGPDWLVPVLLVMLFFGAKKLPELARAVGESLGEFRKATSEMDEQERTDQARTTDAEERRTDAERDV